MNRRVIPEKRTPLADRFSKNASRHLPTPPLLRSALPSCIRFFWLKSALISYQQKALRLIFIPVIAATAAEMVLYGML